MGEPALDDSGYSASSISEAPEFQMSVKVPGGPSGTPMEARLNVYQDSDPAELARAFCSARGLSHKHATKLARSISAQRADLVAARAAGGSTIASSRDSPHSHQPSVPEDGDAHGGSSEASGPERARRDNQGHEPRGQYERASSDDASTHSRSTQSATDSTDSRGEGAPAAGPKYVQPQEIEMDDDSSYGAPVKPQDSQPQQPSQPVGSQPPQAEKPHVPAVREQRTFQSLAQDGQQAKQQHQPAPQSRAGPYRGSDQVSDVESSIAPSTHSSTRGVVAPGPQMSQSASVQGSSIADEAESLQGVDIDAGPVLVRMDIQTSRSGPPQTLIIRENTDVEQAVQQFAGSYGLGAKQAAKLMELVRSKHAEAIANKQRHDATQRERAQASQQQQHHHHQQPQPQQPLQDPLQHVTTTRGAPLQQESHRPSLQQQPQQQPQQRPPQLDHHMESPTAMADSPLATSTVNGDAPQLTSWSMNSLSNSGDGGDERRRTTEGGQAVIYQQEPEVDDTNDYSEDDGLSVAEAEQEAASSPIAAVYMNAKTAEQNAAREQRRRWQGYKPSDAARAGSPTFGPSRSSPPQSSSVSQQPYLTYSQDQSSQRPEPSLYQDPLQAIAGLDDAIPSHPRLLDTAEKRSLTQRAATIGGNARRRKSSTTLATRRHHGRVKRGGGKKGVYRGGASSSQQQAAAMQALERPDGDESSQSTRGKKRPRRKTSKRKTNKTKTGNKQKTAHPGQSQFNEQLQELQKQYAAEHGDDTGEPGRLRSAESLTASETTASELGDNQSEEHDIYTPEVRAVSTGRRRRSTVSYATAQKRRASAASVRHSISLFHQACNQQERHEKRVKKKLANEEAAIRKASVFHASRGSLAILASRSTPLPDSIREDGKPPNAGERLYHQAKLDREKRQKEIEDEQRRKTSQPDDWSCPKCGHFNNGTDEKCRYIVGVGEPVSANQQRRTEEDENGPPGAVFDSHLSHCWAEIANRPDLIEKRFKTHHCNFPRPETFQPARFAKTVDDARAPHLLSKPPPPPSPSDSMSLAARDARLAGQHMLEAASDDEAIVRGARSRRNKEARHEALHRYHHVRESQLQARRIQLAQQHEEEECSFKPTIDSMSEMLSAKSRVYIPANASGRTDFKRASLNSSDGSGSGGADRLETQHAFADQHRLWSQHHTAQPEDDEAAEDMSVVLATDVHDKLYQMATDWHKRRDFNSKDPGPECPFKPSLNVISRSYRPNAKQTVFNRLHSRAKTKEEFEKENRAQKEALHRRDLGTQNDQQRSGRGSSRASSRNGGQRRARSADPTTGRVRDNPSHGPPARFRNYYNTPPRTRALSEEQQQAVMGHGHADGGDGLDDSLSHTDTLVQLHEDAANQRKRMLERQQKVYEQEREATRPTQASRRRNEQLLQKQWTRINTMLFRRFAVPMTSTCREQEQQVRGNEHGTSASGLVSDASSSHDGENSESGSDSETGSDSDSDTDVSGTQGQQQQSAGEPAADAGQAAGEAGGAHEGSERIRAESEASGVEESKEPAVEIGRRANSGNVASAPAGGDSASPNNDESLLVMPLTAEQLAVLTRGGEPPAMLSFFQHLLDVYGKTHGNGSGSGDDGNPELIPQAMFLHEMMAYAREKALFPRAFVRVNERYHQPPKPTEEQELDVCTFHPDRVTKNNPLSEYFEAVASESALTAAYGVQNADDLRRRMIARGNAEMAQASAAGALIVPQGAAPPAGAAIQGGSPAGSASQTSSEGQSGTGSAASSSGSGSATGSSSGSRGSGGGSGAGTTTVVEGALGAGIATVAAATASQPPARMTIHERLYEERNMLAQRKAEIAEKVRADEAEHYRKFRSPHTEHQQHLLRAHELRYHRMLQEQHARTVAAQMQADQEIRDTLQNIRSSVSGLETSFQRAVAPAPPMMSGTAAVAQGGSRMALHTARTGHVNPGAAAGRSRSAGRTRPNVAGNQYHGADGAGPRERAQGGVHWAPQHESDGGSNPQSSAVEDIGMLETGPMSPVRATGGDQPAGAPLAPETGLPEGARPPTRGRRQGR